MDIITQKGKHYMRLYDLSQNYQQILAMIEDGKEGLEDTLASLNDALEVKVENIAKVVRTLEAEVEGLKMEEKRLSDRRKSIENEIKRLKEYTEESMLNADIKRIKGKLFTVSIQRNPQSLKVVDEDLLPKRFYVEQKPKLDRRALLNELKENREIPGAEIRQTESLRIR